MIIIVQDYGASIGKQSNCLVIESSKGKKEISVNQVEELQLYPACSISSDAVQLCMQDVSETMIWGETNVEAVVEPEEICFI